MLIIIHLFIFSLANFIRLYFNNVIQVVFAYRYLFESFVFSVKYYGRLTFSGDIILDHTYETIILLCNKTCLRIFFHRYCVKDLSKFHICCLINSNRFIFVTRCVLGISCACVCFIFF